MLTYGMSRDNAASFFFKKTPLSLHVPSRSVEMVCLTFCCWTCDFRTVAFRPEGVECV